MRLALLLLAGCAAPESAPLPAPETCETPLALRTDIDPPHRVRALYLVASDTPAADAAVRRIYIDRALAALENWYAEAMGAAYDFATFRAEPTVTFASRFTRAEWDDFGRNGFTSDGGVTRSDGCGIWHASAFELPDLITEAGLPVLFSPGTYYLVIGGGGTGGGCGAGGMAAVEEMEADRVRGRCPNGRVDACTRLCADPGGLGDVDPWCTEDIHQLEGYSCTAVGALAHEIGHGFGLPHGADRPVCTGASLMDSWWEYDRGITFCDEDRVDLAASGFFAAP